MRLKCAYIRCALLRRRYYFPASILPVESSLSSIIFDNVEEHDSEDSREIDTITEDTRTAQGRANRNECNR